MSTASLRQPRPRGPAEHHAIDGLIANVNRVLAPVPPLPPPPGPDPHTLPLVYIVGVPRSGTTLVHQLVVRHLDVGYIDNLAARFWERPSVGIALSRALFPESPAGIALSSRHGVADGPHGPHEFGYFWRKWLRLDEAPTHHLDEEAQARVDRVGLRQALTSELLAWLGRPVALRNVICGFHAALLTDVHPPSLFVHVTRDRLAVVRSILRARIDLFGDAATWWSLKPSTYPYSEPDPAHEVIRQAADCLHELEDELAHPDVSALTIAYSDLCADPAAALDEIRQGIGRLGWAVPAPTGHIERLRASPGPELPPHVERQLIRAFEAS